MEATAAFDGEPASVPAARRFVRQTLLGSDAEDFEYVATQLVSELATNAVIHARSRFVVSLETVGDFLRVSVTDGSGRAPVARARSVEATTGRGLAMVAAMAADWGVESSPGGKTVWALLGRGLDPSVEMMRWEPSVEDTESSGADPRSLTFDGLDNFGEDDLRPRLLLV